ncbi:16S rRNA (guanine(527)-N(7))-methyltransferase RsmG [Paenibacillus hamazuiensis]|uniref:16S rRNA (guanine(527)-N(7))-methyltransferase RsmG n=1 Tax=Paenibacillus hamazuiensis TaxID=2936508 RepID=UPI00200D2D2C|nr:16S rRNA (guanine(527)-N(7))-methyltransferase RsmG [Paenibacillus hamazuiensis]
MDPVQSQFAALLEKQNVLLTDSQLLQFENYYKELVSWNEKMNLTAITERDQVYIKHFFDSLSVSFFVPMNNISSMADIGSGAGFPSIPLKIVFPHLSLTIVDSLNKRIQFLNHLCGVLGLNGVQAVHGRAEDAARLDAHRDRYDIVTARAVARLAVLNEFCLPFVKPGGLFVAMKGSELHDELNEAKVSLRELKGELKATYPFELPVDQSARHIIVIQKTGTTPKKYPRKAGTPLKSPLV